uniref:C2H2-type domain-containing protein n=2 Tax=Oreochromis aureus TaxID=47969 RepID=A0AAZ1XKV5_OREAU
MKPGETPYCCPHPYCAEVFVSTGKLLRPMATHLSEKNYKCSYCEKRFHHRDHLKRHLETHDPHKGVFTCQECGRSCSTTLGFKCHLALHAANSGDFTCQVCLKPFPSTEALLEHLRIHAGNSNVGTKDKKYHCEHCEWQFYARKDVRRHMIVHTGHKDFRCQYCVRRYGRKDHLRRHMRTSHPWELLRVKTGSGDSLEPVIQDLAFGSVKGDSGREGVTFLPKEDPESLVQLPCQVATGSEAAESSLQGLSSCSTPNLSTLTTLPRFHEAFQRPRGIRLMPLLDTDTYEELQG